MPRSARPQGGISHDRQTFDYDLLRVCGITKRFGGLTAVNKVSFAVKEREILSVIGPNGARKSTLFKLIAFIPEADV